MPMTQQPSNPGDIVERLKALDDSSGYLQPEISAAIAEIGRLRERLECAHAFQVIDGKMTRVPVEPGSIPDGIECRDETIRQQDRRIEELKTQLSKRATPNSTSVDPEAVEAAREFLRLRALVDSDDVDLKASHRWQRHAYLQGEKIATALLTLAGDGGDTG